MNPNWRANVVVCFLCAAAILLRVVYRVHLGGDDFWQNGYTFFYDIARNIASGKGVWIEGGGWAMRPPVYPFFLALTALAGGHYLFIVIPQAVMGAGTVICAFLIGKFLFGERPGLMAAALTTIYPYYVVHDTALQETSMMTVFAALSVYLLLLSRKTCSPALWLAAGASLGLTVLVRTTMLPFALAAPAWIAFFGTGSPAQKLRRAIVVFLPFAIGVGAWVVRNELVAGRPVLTSEAGLQFWMAHNPYTFSHYPKESIDRSREAAFEALNRSDRAAIESLANELARSDRYMAMGLAYVREHPAETLLGAARKIVTGFSWTFSPARDALTQFVYFASYAPILLLGVAGMLFTLRNWRKLGVIYLQFLSFIAVTGIFWAHTNHRTYLDVYLIVFSAFMLDRQNASPTHPPLFGIEMEACQQGCCSSRERRAVAMMVSCPLSRRSPNLGAQCDE